MNATTETVLFDPQALNDFFQSTYSLRSKASFCYPHIRGLLKCKLQDCLGADFLAELQKTIHDPSGSAAYGKLPTACPIDYLKFMVALGEVIGTPRVDPSSGATISEKVQVDKDRRTISRAEPRSLYRFEKLHQDGAFSDCGKDDYMIFLVAELSDSVGGDSVLLHKNSWPDFLRFYKDPQSREELEMVHANFGAVRRTDAGEPISNRELVRMRGTLAYEFRGESCLHYSRNYFYSPYPEMQEHIERIGESLDTHSSSDAAIRLPMAAGSFYVINNHFWYHGRLPFEPNSNIRRVTYRLLGKLAREIVG